MNQGANKAIYYFNQKALKCPINAQHPQSNHLIMDSESKASKRYMKLYFLKTNYKTILQNNFNNKLKALPPGYHRRPAVLAIVQDKFRELYLEEVNYADLLVLNIREVLFLFQWQDAEWIPISKCCNAQVYLLLNSSSQKTEIFRCTCSRNLQNPPKYAISSASFLPKTSQKWDILCKSKKRVKRLAA